MEAAVSPVRDSDTDINDDQPQAASSSGPGLHLCPQCGKEYKHRGSLYNHQQDAHKNKFVCSVCNMNCHDKRTLEGHMNTHAGSVPYTCKSCNKSYPSKKRLTAHSCPSKSIPCPDCDKSFNSLWAMRQHRLSHNQRQHRLSHSPVRKFLACKFCMQPFKHRQSKRRHEIKCPKKEWQ
jgi:hypothetical protein